MSRSNYLESAFIDIGLCGLAGLFPLTSDHLDLIRAHQGAVVAHGRNAHLEPPGPPSLRFLLDGWAARVRRLPDRRLHIFSFVIPGDVIGQASAHAPGVCEVVALTAGRTVDIDGLRRRLAEGDPAHAPIAAAIGQAGRVAEAHLLDHMVRLGSYNAYMATAHLLLELHDRLSRVGLAQAGRFALPIGQRTLAVALGATSVHMNRVFKALRADGLIDHGAGWVRLCDPDTLRAKVGFTPPAPAEPVEPFAYGRLLADVDEVLGPCVPSRRRALSDCGAPSR